MSREEKYYSLLKLTKSQPPVKDEKGEGKWKLKKINNQTHWTQAFVFIIKPSHYVLLTVEKSYLSSKVCITFSLNSS